MTESFLHSHSLGLPHAVQEMWGSSLPAFDGWGLQGLRHSCVLPHLNMKSQPQYLSLFPGRVRHFH